MEAARHRSVSGVAGSGEQRIAASAERQIWCAGGTPVSTDSDGLDVLLGLPPDRDMTAARAREGLAIPVAPSIMQNHPGEASHEVQL